MGTGKKKIEIKKIEKQSQRMVTFSKRRKGLFKKAQELHNTTGAHIAAIVFSPAGRPYTYGEPSSDTVIDRYISATDTSKFWLELIDVEAYDNVDELLLLKRGLEEIREMLFRGSTVIDRL